jgi:hypothetical protein
LKFDTHRGIAEKADGLTSLTLQVPPPQGKEPRTIGVNWAPNDRGGCRIRMEKSKDNLKKRRCLRLDASKGVVKWPWRPGRSS